MTTRSEIMRAVSQKGSGAEMRVRRYLFSRGFRYRVNFKPLPGSPDIVFTRKRKAIFVHGCFWHRHPGCPKSTTPKTNIEFWSDKFTKNVERDQRNVNLLKQLGWDVSIIWECETQSDQEMKNILTRFLTN